MAEHHNFIYVVDLDAPYDLTVERHDGTTSDFVAWSLDDLPGLAADIHRTVLDLVVHGAPCADVDAAIIDRLRGAAPRAADTGDDAGGLPG